jgi:hypothetical protein
MRGVTRNISESGIQIKIPDLPKEGECARRAIALSQRPLRQARRPAQKVAYRLA